MAPTVGPYLGPYRGSRGVGGFSRGYLAHKKPPTPLGPPEDTGHRPYMVLGGGRFLMSEVPLYTRGTPVCCARETFPPPIQLSPSGWFRAATGKSRS